MIVIIFGEHFTRAKKEVEDLKTFFPKLWMKDKMTFLKF